MRPRHAKYPKVQSFGHACLGEFGHLVEIIYRTFITVFFRNNTAMGFCGKWSLRKVQADFVWDSPGLIIEWISRTSHHRPINKRQSDAKEGKNNCKNERRLGTAFRHHFQAITLKALINCCRQELGFFQAALMHYTHFKRTATPKGIKYQFHFLA